MQEIEMPEENTGQTDSRLTQSEKKAVTKFIAINCFVFLFVVMLTAIQFSGLTSFASPSGAAGQKQNYISIILNFVGPVYFLATSGWIIWQTIYKKQPFSQVIKNVWVVRFLYLVALAGIINLWIFS